MGRRLCFSAMVCLLLVATACGISLPQGESGSIALMPFCSEDLGICGVAPAGSPQVDEGVFDCSGLNADKNLAFLVHQTVPAAVAEELIETLPQELGLSSPPTPAGTVNGAAFTWTWYEFRTQLRNLGEGWGPLDPATAARVDCAIAAGNAKTYLVSLITLPADHEANRAMYESLFVHAVYALTPLP